MKAGLIENWSDVEDIWEYMLYNELGIEEGDHPILITEVANTPRRNREKIAEVRLAFVIVQFLPTPKFINTPNSHVRQIIFKNDAASV